MSVSDGKAWVAAMPESKIVLENMIPLNDTQTLFNFTLTNITPVQLNVSIDGIMSFLYFAHAFVTTLTVNDDHDRCRYHFLLQLGRSYCFSYKNQHRLILVLLTLHLNTLTTRPVVPIPKTFCLPPLKQ